MNSSTDDDMLDDYSTVFARQNAVRGKFFEQAMRSRRLVEIDADLLEAFPDARELNAALRSLIEASRHVKKAA